MKTILIAAAAILAASQAHAGDEIFSSVCTGETAGETYVILLDKTDATVTFGRPDTPADKTAKGRFAYAPAGYILLTFSDAAMLISGDGAGRLIIDGKHADYACTPLAKVSNS